MTPLPRLTALPLLAFGVALAALASPGNVPVSGAAFNPTATLTLSSTSTNAAADMTFDLTVPEGDYAPHVTELTTPADAYVASNLALGSLDIVPDRGDDALEPS